MKGDTIVREIQIKNFRSLKDTGLQTLSPITLLVGENSSGKSTFLRAFPLLKQSISKRTSGPILWAGDIDDYVDFGSFEETVTNDKSKEITFRYRFNIADFGISRRYFSLEYYFDDDTNVSTNNEIDYEITISSSKGKDYVSKLALTINSTQVEFQLIEKSIITNGGLSFKEPRKRSTSTMATQINRVYYGSTSTYSRSFGFTLPDIESLWDRIIDKIISVDREEIDVFELRQALVEIGYKLTISDKISPLDAESADNRHYSPFYFDEYNNIITFLQTDSNSEFSEIIKLFFIYKVFSDIDEYIQNYFKQVHYIAPLRATAERYYRLRNLAVDEVDYQGKNLAIFINSLTPKQLREFHLWTSEHFGFTVSTDKSRGHLSLQIKLSGSDKAINLSDTGFGYSQVLPIITQLWELSSQKQNKVHKTLRPSKSLPLVIAIEQPELHLHPAVQARLAKAFIASIKLARENGYELQLLLETHSETIVNYLGRAIAKGMIQPEDVSVILFEKNVDESVTTVKNSSYDEFGYLQNWPYGFFDSED